LVKTKKRAKLKVTSNIIVFGYYTS